MRRRGSIKQRSPGRWSIIVNLGKDPETGKWRQHWETVKGNKQQAEQRLTELLREQDMGGFVKPTQDTLGEYLQQWLDTVVEFRNQPRTIDGYETIVRKHLVPHLGRILLSKLTAGHLEKLYASLLAQGLSKNTVHHVHVCLSKALNDAVRRGLLGRNVCKMVEAPSPGRYEVQMPDTNGIARILDLAADSPYYAAIFLIANTGMRRAEALALAWPDIDFDHRTANINKSLQRLGKNGLVLTPTKSAASNRKIDLGRETVALLRNHRIQQEMYKLQLGEGWNEANFLFPGPNGNPIDPATLTRNFEKLAQKAGYPGLRLHDLRHFHASDLINGGSSHFLVMKRLGHASAALTMDVYGHDSPGIQAKAANAFEKRLRKALISNSLANPREDASGLV